MSAYVKMEERTMQCGTACTKDCCSVNAEEERNYENKEASKRREKEKNPIMMELNDIRMKKRMQK